MVTTDFEVKMIVTAAPTGNPARVSSTRSAASPQ